MNDQETPKMCFDRLLEGDQLIRAARHAVDENLANVPMSAPPDSAFAPPEPFELALLTRTLWNPGRVLRVRFLGGDLQVQLKVEQVAKIWEEHANITFVFDDDPDAEIRIAFIPNAGSWSYLGTDALGIAKDQPTMNLGWLRADTPDEEYNRVVLHEFGHALGCIHEHQNPATNIPWNKPAVYRAYAGPPNFWPPEKVDVNLFQKYGTNQTQFSQFDRNSIMLYPVPKELTDGIFEVGFNRTLSETDITYIGTIYPFDITPVIRLDPNSPPTEAKIGKHAEEDLFCFEVEATGVYIVETGGHTDVVLGLYGPDDRKNQIAQDDDSGTGLNARIEKELLPGTYYVRVHHFRPRGTGNYTIWVSSSNS